MGKNTENNMTMRMSEEMLQKKILFLNAQKDNLTKHSKKTVHYLCALLILICIIFSLNFENIRIDSNSIRLLWIIVILDIVGLVWIVGRFYHQLKRYNTCIIRLNALRLKNFIKTSNSDKQISEEEICKEVDEIVNDFCFGHNESDSTEKQPADCQGENLSNTPGQQ